MRIKLKYQLVSLAMIALPIVAVLFSWNRLPNRLPLHFDEHGQVDQFGTRQEWIPVLFFLFGSGFVYYGVPPDLPAAPEK